MVAEERVWLCGAYWRSSAMSCFWWLTVVFLRLEVCRMQSGLSRLHELLFNRLQKKPLDQIFAPPQLKSAFLLESSECMTLASVSESFWTFDRKMEKQTSRRLLAAKERKQDLTGPTDIPLSGTSPDQLLPNISLGNINLAQTIRFESASTRSASVHHRRKAASTIRTHTDNAGKLVS